MTGTEIYKRTPTYEREAPSIRLHAPQWKLLLAYDGQRTLSEVALTAGSSFAEALPLTEKFLDSGWIEEQPLTLEQYLKRMGAPDVSSIGAAVPPPIVLHEPKPEGSPALATPPPPLFPAAPKITEPPLAAASAVPTSQNPLRLSALIDYIIAQVGNTALGQLLVYRIFLRVPPELLHTEDIASIRLANNTNTIRTEPLKQAILNAVREVTKRPVPDSVFAPA